MSVTDAMIALFLENAAKSAAVVHRAAGAEQLRSTVAEIVAPDADVFCPCVTELEKTAAADSVRLVPEYASARVTVEEVAGDRYLLLSDLMTRPQQAQPADFTSLSHPPTS